MTFKNQRNRGKTLIGAPRWGVECKWPLLDPEIGR